MSNLAEAKQKVQGLPGNLQQLPQVILNKKQLKMKVKGTNNINIVELTQNLCFAYVLALLYTLIRSTNAGIKD